MTPSKERVIWVLQGARGGDNAQARELASRLGWAVLPKPLAFNILHHLPNIMLGASIASLHGRSVTQLAAPWPDLVIATGNVLQPGAGLAKGALKAPEVAKAPSWGDFFTNLFPGIFYSLTGYFTPFMPGKRIPEFLRKIR